jgi:hypothetical protein
VGISRRLIAPTAPARGSHQKPIAGEDFEGHLAGKTLGDAVAPDQPVLTNGAGFSSVETPGWVAAPLPHERDRCGLVEFDLALDALTPRVETPPA